MTYKYGYFNNEGTEFIITNPETPRAFDNFLWNDSIFSNVQQTGVGYCDYQVGNNEAVQLLTGIGRVCDFDVFGRDNLMSRLIYIRDNDTGEFWNINWEPVCRPYEEYKCVHGLGYTVLQTTVKGIAAGFTIFVPKGSDPVEIWKLKLKNISGKPRNISVFTYVQFQFKFKWNFDSYGDMIFRGSWFNREQNALVASKHPHKKPHDFLTGFMTASIPIEAYDGTRDAFVGIYNSLKEPRAVVNGQCTNTPGSSDATIGAAQFNFMLNEQQEQEFSIILGATDNEKNISSFKDRYFANPEFYLVELKKEKKEMSSANSVKTPDEHFNRMLNSWIKQQTLYGATWCRWGWNGYRDIVQHGFGVTSFEADRTRKILTEAFKYQYSSGLALRGWNPVDEKAYSDSALWLVFTLIAYIKETGDTNFLNEEIPYYDSGTGRVTDHVKQALDFLETNKGYHGLCLIKFGDWNDSLTAVGKDGMGESVWLSEAYAEAMLQMSGLYGFLGSEAKKKDCLKRYERIKAAINAAAWDGNWYTRCFDDNGAPIGSRSSGQGKIFIEAQAWSLIAGIAPADRAEEVIRSCDEKLLTGSGYKLLTPVFTERDDSIGRISCLEPGVCENGTVYSHTNAWMILGLLKMHKADKAYDILKRITPGYIPEDSGSKDKCPPYIFANCYYGPEHRNNSFQMEFTWITGSVAWYNNVLWCDLLGIKPGYDGLEIEPCIPSQWDGYEAVRRFRNSVYNISVKNPLHIQKGTVQLIVDSEPVEGNVVPDFSDGKTHSVEVLIGR